MTYDELILHFGSQAAVARALEISQGAVSLWQIRGIPKLRQYQIAALMAKEPPKIGPLAFSKSHEVVLPLPARWDRTEAGIVAVGRILGIGAHRGESWTEYAKRLRTAANGVK